MSFYFPHLWPTLNPCRASRWCRASDLVMSRPHCEGAVLHRHPLIFLFSPSWHQALEAAQTETPSLSRLIWSLAGGSWGVGDWYPKFIQEQPQADCCTSKSGWSHSFQKQRSKPGTGMNLAVLNLSAIISRAQAVG